MFISVVKWLMQFKTSSVDDKSTQEGLEEVPKSSASASASANTHKHTHVRAPVTFDTVETARLPSEHLEAETKLYLGKFVIQIIALGNRSAEIRETLAEAALNGKDT